MNFVLIVMLLITTPGGDKIETIEVDGFKTESNCHREIARLRVSRMKFSNNVEIVFDHCMRTR